MTEINTNNQNQEQNGTIVTNGAKKRICVEFDTSLNKKLEIILLAKDIAINNANKKKLFENVIKEWINKEIQKIKETL